VLLSTGCVLSAALISLGAVTSVYPAPVGAPAYAVVFLVFLFSVSYATGWGNTPYTLTSELPSDTLRPRTWAIAGSSAALTGKLASPLGADCRNDCWFGKSIFAGQGSRKPGRSRRLHL